MISELSQETPIEPPNTRLNLEQTYEQILIHQNTTSFGRRCITFCITTMIISAAVSLTMIVDSRNGDKKKIVGADTAYLENAKTLATSGNENALIWMAISGYSTNIEYKKLKALAQTTSNPYVIEALLKSNETLRKNDTVFKGLSGAEIKEFKSKGISLGSVGLIEEKYMGNAK